MRKPAQPKQRYSEKHGVTSYKNIQAVGPLTPRLQRPELAPAIGFTVDFTQDDDDE